MHFENTSRLAAKLDEVNKFNLGGIALWRLGMEDPALWPVLESKFVPTGITIRVNSKMIVPDTQPYIDSNNRTMVPLRFISEPLRANIQWDGPDQRVTIIKDNKTIILRVGKKSYLLNNKSYTMDTVPVIKNNRTMVPLRLVAEAFSARVDWNGKTGQIDINL